MGTVPDFRPFSEWRGEVGVSGSPGSEDSICCKPHISASAPLLWIIRVCSDGREVTRHAVHVHSQLAKHNVHYEVSLVFETA